MIVTLTPPIAPIVTPADYEAALARLLALVDADDPGPELDDLSDAIEEYEAPRWGRHASLSIFELVLRIAGRKRAAVEMAYTARRISQWARATQTGKRNPRIDWEVHRVWMADHVERLTNDAIAAHIGEQEGLFIDDRTVQSAMARMGIKRSPAALRKLMYTRERETV